MIRLPVTAALLGFALSALAGPPPAADAAANGAAPGLQGCASLETLDARQKALRPDTAKDDIGAAVAKPALRAELMAMRDRDLKARGEAAASARANGGRPEQSLVFAIFQADQENLQRFKEIVDSDGFPDAKAVGRDGVAAAFVLAQHADIDHAFQARALQLMAPLAERGEVAPQDMALLTDRVRIGQGQPQRYGSQFRIVDAVNHPQPIEDAADVDARRGKAGLIPLRDYGCLMQQAYGYPVDLAPHARIVGQ